MIARPHPTPLVVPMGNCVSEGVGNYVSADNHRPRSTINANHQG